MCSRELALQLPHFVVTAWVKILHQSQEAFNTIITGPHSPKSYKFTVLKIYTCNLNKNLADHNADTKIYSE